MATTLPFSLMDKPALAKHIQSLAAKAMSQDTSTHPLKTSLQL